MDDSGSQVTNGAQVPLDSLNSETINEDGVMHVFFKTHLSTCTQTDSGGYAYAGVYCDLMGDTLQYFNFDSLTEISMKIKGTGVKARNWLRILFQTKDIYEMTDSAGNRVEWGYYGHTVRYDSTYLEWKELKISSVLLKPELYSPAADCLWQWAPDSLHPEGGRKHVKGFAIETIPDDYTTTDDSVELYVDNIVFKGLDYKQTFGFDFDTILSIIYIPENNLKMNINAFPNRYTRAINISYDLEQRSHVSIAIFDTKGKRVAELINEKQNRGHHILVSDFNTKEISSGVYFLYFRINEFSTTRKFSFIK